MIRLIIILGFLLNLTYSHATDYYVSNSGNNNNSGTSQPAAWATTSRVNSALPSMRAGDRVFFERGGRFSGYLSLSGISGNASNPIVIGAYGSGANPIIDASAGIEGWIQSGNIWTANCSDCPREINNLFIDRTAQRLGRWPNDDYRRSTDGSGKNVMHDNNLSSPDHHWDGADLVISTQSWVRDAVRVSSQIGARVYLAESTSYAITGGVPYFFQNHINALDREGEWAHSNVNREIYVYTSRNLSNSEVTFAYHSNVIAIRNCHYVTVENLTLSGAAGISFHLEYSDNIRFYNNSIVYSGTNAISLRSCDYTVIDNNYIVNTNNIGLQCSSSSHCSITNNVFEYTGNIPGRGGNGSGSYTGIIFDEKGSNNVVEYNTLFYTGYNAISWYPPQSSLLIKNNFIRDFCTVNSDGAGIYTWQSQGQGNRIMGNIILRSKYDYGIYLDESSRDIELSGNTVAFCNSGIFLHNCGYIDIHNNTLFDNQRALLLVRHAGLQIDYNDVKWNHFFSLGGDKHYSIYARFVQGDNNVFEHNIHADPFRTGLIYSESSIWGTDVYTVGEWQSMGYLTDKSVPLTFAESGLPDTTDFVKFIINPTKSSKSFNLSGNYRDLMNGLHAGSVTLEPYSSIVLLLAGRTELEGRTILEEQTAPSEPSTFCQGTESSAYSTVGVSQATDYHWSLSPLPSTPIQPSGPSQPLQHNPPSNYVIPEALNATSYEWDLSPSNAGAVSGANSSITVTWDEPFFGGTEISSAPLTIMAPVSFR